MNDLVGGHVDFFCEQVVSVAEQIAAGTIKAYGVSASERLASLPNVPTAKEAGVDYRMSIWAGIFAPKGTPREITGRLASALDRAFGRSQRQETSNRSRRIDTGEGRAHAGEVRDLRPGRNRPLVSHPERSQRRGEVTRGRLALKHAQCAWIEQDLAASRAPPPRRGDAMAPTSSLGRPTARRWRSQYREPRRR